MCEWTDCPGHSNASGLQLEISPSHPLPQLEQLRPSSSKDQPHLPMASNESSRFKFSSEEQLSELAKGLIPENTKGSTNWALKNFNLWLKSRNDANPENPVPEDILTSSDPDLLNHHLSQFVVETRKANGEHYPPSTLHQLLCGLLRHMREVNPCCSNFLNKIDARFRPIQRTMDAYFHNLHSQGLGRIKHAEIITPEEEEQLWESGIMNSTTPKGLQNAVFHLVGKAFCLRGGAEQRNLKLSQFERCDDSYVYHENTSKNRNGSFKQLHVKKKVVPIYSCPQAGDRCPVYLLDKYISKLPEEAKEKDLFYVRPLESMAESADTHSVWYSAVPIGKHTLQQKFSKMCQAAGIVGHKTNHSLRATAASEMFAQQVPEKLIQERTGHRSLEALRTYERSNEEQHRAVSSVLCETKRSNYSQQLIQHSTKSRSLSIHGMPSTSATESQSSSFAMPGNVMFNNLHGCTINITQAPPPAQSPLTPNIELTENELDELFSQF